MGKVRSIQELKEVRKRRAEEKDILEKTGKEKADDCCRWREGGGEKKGQLKSRRGRGGGR